MSVSWGHTLGAIGWGGSHLERIQGAWWEGGVSNFLLSGLHGPVSDVTFSSLARGVMAFLPHRKSPAAPCHLAWTTQPQELKMPVFPSTGPSNPPTTFSLQPLIPHEASLGTEKTAGGRDRRWEGRWGENL